MKKKIIAFILAIVVLIAGGVFYITRQFQTVSHRNIKNLNNKKDEIDSLDEKEEVLFKKGFRLLEEQLGTYIKEHYSGVSKIEFSPIFIEGDRYNPPITADIVPVIYDQDGNRAIFGSQIGDIIYPSYGYTGDVFLDFDSSDQGKILLENSAAGQRIPIDVSQYKSLPDAAKLNESSKIDINIAALVKDKQLSNIIKSEIGSPEAEVIYNLDFKKGDYSRWR